jgi:sugar phosphate isomerase/epimerase
MRLGTVTYNMGKDMDCAQLIDLCKQTGMEGVELRTTHKHGVEITLSQEERKKVKEQFASSGIEIAQLGTTCEFHSTDPAEIKKRIEEGIEFIKLAADVGSHGIKVRPNGLQVDKGVPVEKTCEQIGQALRQLGVFGEGLGVKIRVEVHGKGTQEPKNFRLIMDAADHKNVYANWNSNPTDMDENKSISKNFDLLKDKIDYCHINEIGVYQYPWQELFDKLKAMNYSGWCMAEIAPNDDPVRFMRFYRTLFDVYTGKYKWDAGTKYYSS